MKPTVWNVTLGCGKYVSLSEQIFGDMKNRLGVRTPFEYPLNFKK